MSWSAFSREPHDQIVKHMQALGRGDVAFSMEQWELNAHALRLDDPRSKLIRAYKALCTSLRRKRARESIPNVKEEEDL